MSSDRFTILFVCTGNQCRSPMAEAVVRSLAEHLPVEVSSAGTDVFQAVPSPKKTLRAASALGYDLVEHRSRPLGETNIDSADLVVGFEIAHVATAVVKWGTDRTKTWLLPQLVSALEGEPISADDDAEDVVSRARARLARAHERRGSAPPMLNDQIADPMGGSARTHEATARTIDDLCKQMVAGLLRANRTVERGP